MSGSSLPTPTGRHTTTLRRVSETYDLLLYPEQRRGRPPGERVMSNHRDKRDRPRDRGGENSTDHEDKKMCKIRNSYC